MINSIPENSLVSDQIKFSFKEIPDNIVRHYPCLSGGIFIDVDQSEFNILNSVLALVLLSDFYFKELNYNDIITDLFEIYGRSMHDLNNNEWTILIRNYLSKFNIINASFAIILSDDNLMFHLTELSKDNKENLFIIVKDNEKYNAIYFKDASSREMIFDELISKL